ncbi:MAG: hypothetical protein A3C82_01270 [Candidatus Wildermuthbacteria bacterium RIFCSPHIGHO2_02_FULL_47_12]|uniref:Transcription elongation factor GreA/GreB C-terminal domain-containing protein n=2 Tax=Parcubacteria group TaxID=1794811 RepID=A0A1G2R1H6_9BACT|nr:MAG: hypothetical protein A3A24_03585 [Candidatus Buchananbacteria bacterium RIFCSPLOWO2_01_FULL_46_12]OHA66735.1 MAG: hypothetical protein A3C82_01270 [Candidatus Wildermuthbacteria bacterium RIFCSPHIGHO2_02_FULL_47_12]
MALSKRDLVDALIAKLRQEIPAPVMVSAVGGGDFQERIARQGRENDIMRQIGMLGNGTSLLAPAVTVGLGAIVRFEYLPDGVPLARFILPAAVGEVLPGGIIVMTLESPLGNALQGHKKGEIVTVKTPKGYRIVEILSVE